MCVATGTGPFNTDDCVQAPPNCLIICAKSSDAAKQTEAAASTLSPTEKDAIKARTKK